MRPPPHSPRPTFRAGCKAGGTAAVTTLQEGRPPSHPQSGTSRLLEGAGLAPWRGAAGSGSTAKPKGEPGVLSVIRSHCRGPDAGRRGGAGGQGSLSRGQGEPVTSTGRGRSPDSDGRGRVGRRPGRRGWAGRALTKSSVRLPIIHLPVIHPSIHHPSIHPLSIYHLSIFHQLIFKNVLNMVASCGLCSLTLIKRYFKILF